MRLFRFVFQISIELNSQGDDIIDQVLLVVLYMKLEARKCGQMRTHVSIMKIHMNVLESTGHRATGNGSINVYRFFFLVYYTMQLFGLFAD